MVSQFWQKLFFIAFRNSYLHWISFFMYCNFWWNNLCRKIFFLLGMIVTFFFFSTTLFFLNSVKLFPQEKYKNNQYFCWPILFRIVRHFLFHKIRSSNNKMIHFFINQKAWSTGFVSKHVNTRFTHMLHTRVKLGMLQWNSRPAWFLIEMTIYPNFFSTVSALISFYIALILLKLIYFLLNLESVLIISNWTCLSSCACYQLVLQSRTSGHSFPWGHFKSKTRKLIR